MSIRVSHSHIKNAKSVLQYSYSQNKNFPTRQYMEDNFIAIDNFPTQNCGLFAILDGHGGSKVSQYCIQAIPRLFHKSYLIDSSNINKIFISICSQIDQQLISLNAQDIGTTCCLAFIRKQNNKKICTIGNLGDTRAVICQNNKARRVTVDHKVTNVQEEQRIKSQGGFILHGRVGGQLAITRALGDLAFKSIGASNVPEIQQFQITQEITEMVIASDGLWDVCDDNKAIQLIRQLPSTKFMSRKLVEYATKNDSKDNISVLAIRF